MAFSTINRNSGLFTPIVCDELNVTIDSIDNAIDNLEVPALDYKLDVVDIKLNINRFNNTVNVVNTSVKIGLELWYHIEITAKTATTLFGRLTTTTYKPTVVMISQCCTDKGNIATVTFNTNGEISISNINLSAGEKLIIHAVDVN